MQQRVPDDEAITDDYAYLCYSSSLGAALFQADSDNPFTETAGFRGVHVDSTRYQDSVYVPPADRLYALKFPGTILVYEPSATDYALEPVDKYDIPGGNFDYVYTISYNRANDNIVLGFEDGNDTEAVTSYDRTTQTESFRTTASGAEYVDVDNTGSIYADADDAIYKLDSSGNVQAMDTTASYNYGNDVAVGADGTIYETHPGKTIVYVYQNDLSSRTTASPSGDDGVRTVCSTGDGAAIISSDDPSLSRVTASGTVDWERPFQEEVFLCGTTPAGEAIIQREVGKPKETEVIIIDSETGDELHTHSRNFPRPNEARGVFAPRAGAYPEEY